MNEITFDMFLLISSISLPCYAIDNYVIYDYAFRTLKNAAAYRDEAAVTQAVAAVQREGFCEC